MLSLLVLSARIFAIGADTTREARCGCTDSLFFDGYYVVLYTKADINRMGKNRKRRLEGKSFQVPYESSALRFFVSKDSVADRNFAAIIDELPKRDKKEVFIECTADYAEELGKAFCGQAGGGIRCAWPNLPSGNRYFTAGKKSPYCFRLFELSGWFVRLRIDNEDKRNAVGKKLRLIDPRLKNFDAYFFVGYTHFSAGAPSLGNQVHFWKEVLPIFD